MKVEINAIGLIIYRRLIHPFVHSSIHPFIHLSIHPSIHLFIHPSTCSKLPQTLPAYLPLSHTPLCTPLVGGCDPDDDDDDDSDKEKEKKKKTYKKKKRNIKKKTNK